MAMLQLKCPATGEPVDVADCSPNANIALSLWSRPVACPHCGEDHAWTSGHLKLAMEALKEAPGASRALLEHLADGVSAAALP